MILSPLPMSAAIAPTTRLCRSDQIMTTDLAPRQSLLMDVDEARYFELTGPAAQIWAEFAEESTIDRVVAALLDQFDVNEARCRAETTACVTEMLERSLLRVVP